MKTMDEILEELSKREKEVERLQNMLNSKDGWQLNKRYFNGVVEKESEYIAALKWVLE